MNYYICPTDKGENSGFSADNLLKMIKIRPDLDSISNIRKAKDKNGIYVEYPNTCENLQKKLGITPDLLMIAVTHKAQIVK